MKLAGLEPATSWVRCFCMTLSDCVARDYFLVDDQEVAAVVKGLTIPMRTSVPDGGATSGRGARPHRTGAG
jgi:hypothetical protein